METGPGVGRWTWGEMSIELSSQLSTGCLPNVRLVLVAGVSAPEVGVVVDAGYDGRGDILRKDTLDAPGDGAVAEYPGDLWCVAPSDHDAKKHNGA
ncbi:hypothetical protein VDGL01_05549 [Verticillium dahliae]